MTSSTRRKSRVASAGSAPSRTPVNGTAGVANGGRKGKGEGPKPSDLWSTLFDFSSVRCSEHLSGVVRSLYALGPGTCIGRMLLVRSLLSIASIPLTHDSRNVMTYEKLLLLNPKIGVCAWFADINHGTEAIPQDLP